MTRMKDCDQLYNMRWWQTVKVTPRVPFHISLIVCGLAVALFISLRVLVFPDRIVPLGFALPLFLCLWNRDRRFLWGMAALFVVFTIVRVFWMLPDLAESYQFYASSMMIITIIGVAVVVDRFLNVRVVLEASNESLRELNAELETANEELAAREEEITRQNEELQSQTEELEQQHEELRQQTEELETTSEELQVINTELTRRESALQIFLESTSWLAPSLDPAEVMHQICRAAVQAMENEAVAAAILEKSGGEIIVRGHYGFGKDGPRREKWKFEHSLASIVMERGGTAFIKDVALRPDLNFLQPQTGNPLVSAIAAPLHIEGKISGVIEILAATPYEWTEDNFKMINWLASQSSIVCEAIRRRDELTIRREEAEEASVRKTRFLAAVSHDVRTPANAIGLLADLMIRHTRNTNDNKLSQIAHNIKDSSRLLVDLVSDVLDIARFDSGKMEIQHSTFDLNDLIKAEINQIAPLAEKKGLKVHAAFHNEGITVHTDKVKLARIIGNLIGNGVKFTDNGEVAVAVKTGQSGVTVSVQDTGIGIEPAQVNFIFDEFYQVKNRERDRNKGTGLGLAICKRLVDGLGCSLSVESVPGQGTTFHVSIPKEILRAPGSGGDRVESYSTQKWSGDRQLKGLHILLVEDHSITRDSTSEILESEGALVTVASDGNEALNLVAKVQPDVVLLDLMLPDFDGAEVLKSVQKSRPSGLQAIYALSGDVTESRRQETKSLGASGLIEKPIESEKLVEVLRQHALKKRKVRQESVNT